MNHYEALREVAASQDGLVTMRQAHELGLAESTVRWLIANRGWERVQPGVIALPGAERSAWRSLRAATLSVEAGAVSHTSALWAWGLVRAAPTVVELTLPFTNRAEKRDGVAVHRSRQLKAEDVTKLNGCPVTTPARTLCDVAAALTPEFLRALTIDARQRRLATLEEIETTRVRLGRRAGSGRLGRILWELAEERCDSVLEHTTRRWIAASDLPAPYPEPYPVRIGGRTIHIDIAWPRYLIGLECLGLGSHSERRHLDIDALRSNLLASTPWRILLVTWTRIECDPHGLMEEIRRALRAARAAMGQM